MTKVFLNNVCYTCVHSSDYAGVVNRLRKMEVVPCSTNAKYMERVKERFKIFYGFVLQSNNEETFVKQLIKYNELRGTVI